MASGGSEGFAVTRSRQLFLLLALALMFLIGRLAGISDASPHRLSGHPKTVEGKLVQAKKQLAHDRREANVRKGLFVLLSPVPMQAFLHSAWVARDLAYIARMRRQLFVSSWLVRAFGCIHSHEGDWEDGGDPYWGGLQMNRQFMRTYGADMLRKYGEPQGFVGPNGWLNPWSKTEQITVAIRAYRSGRGFYPWPTRRYCGL
jgi:hypothetical protein